MKNITTLKISAQEFFASIGFLGAATMGKDNMALLTIMTMGMDEEKIEKMFKELETLPSRPKDHYISPILRAGILSLGREEKFKMRITVSENLEDSATKTEDGWVITTSTRNFIKAAANICRGCVGNAVSQILPKICIQAPNEEALIELFGKLSKKCHGSFGFMQLARLGLLILYRSKDENTRSDVQEIIVDEALDDPNLKPAMTAEEITDKVMGILKKLRQHGQR